MSAMVDLLSSPTWQHLAIALLHTLWQGAVAAAALAVLLRCIPANRPGVRYGAAFSLLMGLLLGGLVTWSVLDVDWSGKQTPIPATAEASFQAGASENRAAARPSREREGTLQSPPTSLPRAGEGRLATAFAPLDRDTSLKHGARTALTLVLAAWLLGVALMTARMAWLVVRVHRFVGRQEVTDRVVCEVVGELCRALCLTRLPRIVQTVEDFGPAVLGVVRPVMVLPVSMLTGLPPDALRAIVAHELAHIRRHDYLLNLVQMAIEAVLFFNPAVWWISRQVRIEREACCDAMAAQVLGQPLVLAESLALWAERAALRASAAMAISGSGGHGRRVLLDRVLRILTPDYRPHTPLSPWGFVGVLLGGIVLLGALSCGTSAVVELAAKALTPDERIQRIVEAQRQFVPSSIISTDGKATLAGVIRTKDGKPVPKEVVGRAYTRSERRSVTATFSVQSPTFSTTVPLGESWLALTAEGYAPAIVGPFVGKAGETISGIEVVLDAGFPLTIRVVDDKGLPVAGATVGGSIDNCAGAGQQLTDAQGTAVFPHAVAGEYVFSVSKPGFEFLYSHRIPIAPRQASATLTLARTRPVRGVVRSADGRPVAGAEIREFYTVRGQGSYDYTATRGGHVLATTDAQGRFVLDQLYNDGRYCLMVAAKGQGRQLLDDVSAGAPDLQVKLGPPLTVAGRIQGDLKKLPQDGGKPVVRCTQRARLAVREGNGDLGVQVGCPSVAVKPVDGGGEFLVQDLLPGTVVLTAGRHQATTAVSSAQPQARVSIDLTQPVAQPVKRQVVMWFTSPDGKVSPQGKVRVQVSPLGEGHEQESKELPIVDGRIAFDVGVPASVNYESRSLIGYWFRDGSALVEPGDTSLVIEVPVQPAGAIAGHVLKADGSPATENVQCGLRWTLRTRETNEAGFNNIQFARGKFFASPLRLSGTYTVMAYHGHNIQVAGPVKLDEANPTVTVNLQLPPTTSASGRVLDAAGKPLAGFPFSVGFYDAERRISHGWSGDSVTDEQGRFRLTDLSAGIGQYAIELQPRKDYCPAHFPLPRDGKPLTVRLERGLVLEGQVLDEKTGWPIPGVELYALPQPFSEGQMSCEAEAVADRDGRFRFSNLKDQPYQIGDRAGLTAKAPDDRIRRPGKEPLLIRATLPSWSSLKPRPSK